jgi:4-hydroxy-tetrahydrodipicolinate synthase
MKMLSVSDCYRSLHHGLIPAVPVPFGTSGEIAQSAQEPYIAYMAGQPIAGVAVWAHTGRGLLLTEQQRIQVLHSWRDGLPSDKILIAGVGCNRQSTAVVTDALDSALRMATTAIENGAQALLAYPPTHLRNSINLDALALEYHQELASLGAPVILFYLYEAAGGISYSVELLRRLFALPQVVGIKFATLDSVMTFQDVASVIRRDFPDKLLITGEDRFLGYSLMCGAQSCLIGMGSACTQLQRDLMDAHFQGRAADFLKLSRLVDDLGQSLFVAPMEGYIRRVLLALVSEGVVGLESTYDPWGPELRPSEFSEIEKVVRQVNQFESIGK